MLCDFLLIQAAEELQLDYLGLPRVDGCQRRQGVIQRHKIGGRFVGNHEGFVQCGLVHAATVLLISARTGEVNQNTAHELGRKGEEMGTVLPPHLTRVDEPQIGFVDQCRRLQCMAGPLAGHVVAREAVEVVVNQRCQRSKCLRISLAPSQKELRDVSAACLHRLAAIVQHAADGITPER